MNKKQRRHLQASASSIPTYAEIRFSTRKAAKVSNYNEDDDDEMFIEDEPENLTPNYWAAGGDDDVPAIDAVLNHRLRDGISESSGDSVLEARHSLEVGKDVNNPGRDDFEYFVSPYLVSLCHPRSLSS